MRYMKVWSLPIVGFAFAATMVLGQGNQEAAKLTREGIEASKAKDWDKAIAAFRKAAQLEAALCPQSGLGVAAARYHLREPEEISGSDCRLFRGFENKIR